MLDVTVKTLDSKTRQFSVPEQITVKEFKERIAGSVNIPAGTQRLIFCGRVLQDSKKLSEYDVNGRTIHLVEKPPPSTTSTGSSTSSSTTRSQPGGSGGEGRDSFFMGAITVQADVADSGNVQPNGSHMDVHINLGPINVAPPVSASQQRINQIQILLRQVNVTLDRLENPMQQQSTQTEPASAASGSTPTSSAAPASGSPPTTIGASTPTNQQGSATDSQTRDNQGRRIMTVSHPRGTVMADILTEMARVVDRLQPHLDQYRELLSGDQIFEGDNERQSAHRLQTLVNQALHYISHIYHAVSDCMMDLHTAPPRVLRAPAGMMVAPIRPPGPMPVHVNISQGAQGSAPSAQEQAPPQSARATTSASNQQQQQQQQPTPASSDSSRRASTRSSATSFTQTQPREQQGAPVLTNASVTLTNQQTFVLTPRAGGPGYMAMPVSSASGQPAGTGSRSTTQQGTGAAQTERRQAGNHGGQSQGPQVHIHQVGLSPGSIPPAGLLQVMAQMVGQQQMQQMAQFPANHAGPTNTSSTPTTSSPRAQQNPQSTPSPQSQSQSRQGPPPMAFFNPLQSRPTWDPLLPCNSRHVATYAMPVGPSGRGRAGAATRQDAGTGTAGPGENAADRNPRGDPQGDAAHSDGIPQPMAADGELAGLSDVIGGLVGALLNQPQQPFVQVVHGSQQATQQARNAAAQQSSSRPASGGTPSRDPAEQGGRSGEPLTDQMLMNMVLRMSQEIGAVGTGQRGSQSLRQFLVGMGMTLDPSEGFIGDVFDLVTQQLGMADFAAMFLGQPAPLDRLRPSLEQFVNQRIMRGEPMTPDNIQVAVGRIMDELQPSVSEFMEGAQTVQNIDAVATHMRFLRSVLEQFVHLFTASSDVGSFGVQMRSLGQNCLHQWVALMLHIFGDRSSADRFLSERLRTWFGGLDSASSNLVLSMSMQNFDLAHRLLTVTPDQVAHFVVKKQPASDSGPSDCSAAEPSPTSATAGAPIDTEQRPDQLQDSLENDQVIIEAQIVVEEPMDTVVAPELAQGEAAAPADRSCMEGATPTSTEAAATPVPAATHAEDGAVAMETAGWEATVPAWVPVINQDISRQRRQAPQGGLSDAYLAGMPPKRMKLTQDRKAPINNGVETFVPDTLRRAIQGAGVQPLTSVQSLVQDAEGSSSLHEACEEQIRSAVQERLRRDPDYDPQRFPNTDKYIHKKK
ncbi:large proline-rich protein BAG6-like isoform X2 [Acanthaster planci]|uniref:BCL2-associated athanogene 6 n=1 Tax=Acanthaster planci TaxID=133434 RepID=A0A8B7Z0L1_ACAPL|nr:large proline-rich protein BAG6-like isoform X2 [Acanthaster planci]